MAFSWCLRRWFQATHPSALVMVQTRRRREFCNDKTQNQKKKGRIAVAVGKALNLAPILCQFSNCNEMDYS